MRTRGDCSAAELESRAARLICAHRVDANGTFPYLPALAIRAGIDGGRLTGGARLVIAVDATCAGLREGFDDDVSELVAFQGHTFVELLLEAAERAGVAHGTSLTSATVKPSHSRLSSTL